MAAKFKIFLNIQQHLEKAEFGLKIVEFLLFGLSVVLQSYAFYTLIAVAINTASVEWYNYIYMTAGAEAPMIKYIFLALCIFSAFVVDFFMVRNPSKVIVGMGYNIFMRRKYGDTFLATNTPVNNGTLANMMIIFVIGVVISGSGQMLGIGVTTAAAHKAPDTSNVEKLDRKRAEAIKSATKIEQSNYDRLVAEQARVRAEAKKKVTSSITRRAKVQDPDALAIIAAADTAGNKYDGQITLAQTNLEKAKTKADKDFDGTAGIIKGVAQGEMKNAVELSEKIVGSSHRLGLLFLGGGIFVSIGLALISLKKDVDTQMHAAGVTELVEVDKTKSSYGGVGNAGGYVANP